MRLRDELRLPGMAVLLWAFAARRESARAENFRRRAGRYTGDARHRHGASAGDALKPAARSGRGSSGRASLGVDRAGDALARVACIVPAQDVLGLGSEARMNRPGEV